MEHNIELDRTNQPKIAKIIETVITWLLGFCFFVGVTTIAKIADSAYRYTNNSNSRYGFVDIILQLVSQTKDLKALETLGTIYRAFLLILIVAFSILVLFRIVSKELNKLMQFSSVVTISSILTSSYLIYLTKDIFYAIKSINSRIYSTDISKAIYLMAKLQHIKNIRIIIMSVLFMTIVLTFFAFVSNFYQVILKTDKVYSKKLSSIFLSISLLLLTIFGAFNYHIVKNKDYIDPFDYFVLGYTLNDKNEIVPKSYINYKKIESKYIDPFLVNFLEYGLTFDISDSKKSLVGDENLKINVAYDLDKAKEIGIKINKLDNYIKLNSKPMILQKVDDFNVESFNKFLHKYEIRYFPKANKKINDSENVTGIYYSFDDKNNIEIYTIQKILKRFLPNKVLKTLSSDTEYVYSVSYFGNVYINDKKEVIGISALNNASATIHLENIEEVQEAIKKLNINKVN